MVAALAIAMQKGGVGKTTTAINLAAGLALGDYRTLLIDLDPQANATSGLGVELGGEQPTVYQLIHGQAPPAETIIKTEVSGLDLLPASLQLNNARAELAQNNSQYSELADQLSAIEEKYEKIIIDCPPALGPLTLNGLAYAKEVIIPLQCEYYALEGLSQLWQTIQRVQNQLNRELQLTGILLTMYDSRTNLAQEVKAETERFFPDRVLATYIPRNIKIGEAPGYGKPVMLHAPCSRGSTAYLRTTEEVIYREQQRSGPGT